MKKEQRMVAVIHTGRESKDAGKTLHFPGSVGTAYKVDESGSVKLVHPKLGKALKRKLKRERVQERKNAEVLESIK